MVGLVLACGLSVLAISQTIARHEAKRLADDLFGNIARQAADQSRGYLDRVGPVLNSLKRRAESNTHGLDDDQQLLKVFGIDLQANEGISWISFADPSGRFVGVTRDSNGAIGTNVSHIKPDGKTRLVESNLLPDGVARVTNIDEDSGYDPRTRSFYQAAVAAGGDVAWLEPYVFYGQNVPGITCATAVIKDDQVRGVLTIDFTLEAITRHFATLRASDNSLMFLFTSSGKLIAQQRAGSAASKAGAQPVLNDVPAEVRELKSRFDRGEKRFTFQFDGQTCYAQTTAFDVGSRQQWIVGIIAPASDFLGGVQRGQRSALYACLTALVATTLLAVWLSGRVSRPVGELTELMQRIGGGDLDAQANLRGPREFRRLSASLNRMVGELRDGLRLRHSIGVAMEVQKRLLPSGPPAIPGLDIAGFSKYCDETGGDYYDFLITQPTGPQSLTLVVGDVMGHGIGSALVMASVRAVLRDRADDQTDLAPLLSRLNQIVSRDTGGAQFMTMLLATVDVRQATYRFVSAGHDPALIYRAASQQVEEVDEGSLPLGVMEESEFREPVVGLQVGDVILVGTDGVWETKNEQGDEFGKDRVRAVLKQHSASSARIIAQALERKVDEFRGSSPVFDDVTFAIVKFLGGSVVIDQGEMSSVAGSKSISD